MDNKRERLIKQIEGFRDIHRTFVDIMAQESQEQKEELICSRFGKISGAVGTALFIKSQKTARFQFRAAVGKEACNYEGGFFHGDPPALGESGLTAAHSETITIQTQSAVYDFKDKFIMVLPVLAFSRVYGILLCEYNEARTIDDADHVELINVVLAHLTFLFECFLKTERLEEKAKSLELLYEIGSVLSRIRDEDQLLEAILRLVEGYLLVDRCSLMIIDEDRKNLRIKRAFGLHDVDIRSVKVPLGMGIAGHVAMGTQPLLIKDITAEGHLISQVQHKEDFRTNSLLSVPLVSQGEVIGVINVNNRKDGLPFTEEDMELLSKIGSEIAAVLQRSYMGLQLKKARELNDEVKRFMPI